ncbi:MAG: type I secretion system permease/ATPase, partial [Bradyrhizobiaceae bacterium]
MATDAPRSEIAEALRSCRSAFLGIALLSGVINVLYLTGSFFMLEVYDRVLPSRSIPTLVGLVVIAGTLFAFLGVLDLIRARVLVRIGLALDEALSPRVYDTVVRLPLKTRAGGDGLQSVRDLDQVRAFLSGLGPVALFDLPWMPLYLAICFAFHVWIGVAALAGAIVLVALTLMTELLARAPSKDAAVHATTRNALAEASRRNAEVVQAMGMGRRLYGLWSDVNAKYMASQRRASDVAGGLGAASKVMRMAVQSAVLAVGAYLVIQQQATAGIIIAASILTARALAPVELAIAHWRSFLTARQSWRRLAELL